MKLTAKDRRELVSLFKAGYSIIEIAYGKKIHRVEVEAIIRDWLINREKRKGR